MTNETKNPALPDVLMLTGEHCSFCGPMKIVLEELKDDGEIGQLEFISIEEKPGKANELGVRSVPWIQIGPFELSGSRSKNELSQWLSRAASGEGIRQYLEEMLAEGDIGAAEKLIRRSPQTLEYIIELMADADAKINVRLGVGVIIEDMAESEEFKTVIPQLVDYLTDPDARVRGDACHYLSLTKDSSVVAEIRSVLNDESDEVREIAQDSLEELQVDQ
jgi:hypothetical protein